jgi:hypothetical protein
MALAITNPFCSQEFQLASLGIEWWCAYLPPQPESAMSSEQKSFPVLRGRSVRVDENGMVCLNDIHKAGGFSVNRTPAQWQRLPFVTGLIVAVYKRNVGFSHNSKISMKTVIYVLKGADGGTYADRRLALAYAEYLSPDLALEVKDVFLRYMDGDPLLADDILQRATPEANEWVGQRAVARSNRNRYTDVLKAHGADGADYARCTDELYKALFDSGAVKLRERKGLPKKANLRDQMSTAELAFVAASEALSSERIEEENCQGGTPCRIATGKSAGRIRDAIEADRKDRRSAQQSFL